MKNYRSILIGAASLLVLGTNDVLAQEKPAQEKDKFWGESGAYFEKQSFEMFKMIDESLTQTPPMVGRNVERQMALYSLDAMLHETKYDACDAFNEFVESRIAKTIEELKKPVKRGMKIFKIYNDGFIVKTKTSTVAFDIVRGMVKGKQIVQDAQIKELVDMCDLMLISHLHGDHADGFVANLFLDNGKQVIAPTNLWQNNERITHLRSEEPISKRIEISEKRYIDLQVFPGHQSDLDNNIYVVKTQDGKTFAQIGDQYNKEDMEWIANIKNNIPRLDALIVNCWSYRLEDLVEGFNPKLVVSGHENEMGHTIDHREAFWLTFQKMKPLTHDYLIMCWGECYTL